MPTAKRAISSRVTIQNPRPRKYASAAERQKALRERFPTLCVRVEQEQADFMRRIADEQGRTLQDVHLAFIKYANGRGALWLKGGLKDFKPLPRFEETPKENPMKRKPTPAQLAARERFAEMARSGAFKKKASKARKVKSNPISYGLDGVVNITDTYERSVASSRNLAEHYANQLRMRGREDIVYVVFGITPEAKAQAGRLRTGVTITLAPRDYEIAYAFHPTQGEISRQLKAQRDAERRAYTRQGMKLKTNPRASNPIVLVTDSKPSKRKANPQAPSIKRKGARNIAYAVEAKRMIAGGGSQFEMIAGFPTKAQAQDYIDALLKSYPKGLTLRISAA
jgi:hypothetical protein